MGFILDILRIEQLVKDPVTVNTDFTSDVVDLSFREEAFAIQLDYDSGTSVDMKFFIEFSVDGITFARDVESVIELTDNEHTIIWDIEESGVAYIRIGIEVVGGSIDLQQVLVKQKRRH